MMDEPKASAYPGDNAGVTATSAQRECKVERCEISIHIGLFFDGTGNNQDWVENPSVNWRQGLLDWWSKKPRNTLTQLQRRCDSNVARYRPVYLEDPQGGCFRAYIAGVGTHLRLPAFLLSVATAFFIAGCQSAPREKTVGVMLTGLDHLDAHLSIQNFWVNGVSGHQAGRGGSSVCCVSLPAVWRPDLAVEVEWGVTNWPRKAYSMHKRVVPVDRYEKLGDLHIHFLRNGEVRAVSSMYGAWDRDGYYPGPSYDTVLRKKPWTVYKRNPEEPLFAEVPDAAALGGPQ